ncbi:MAG: hypothetical protein AB7P17_01430 [Nitrospirales bacterium]
MNRSHMPLALIGKAWFSLGVFALSLIGCVHQLDSQPPAEALKEPLVFGKFQLWQDQPSGRIFLPDRSSIEFTKQDTGTRYRMEVDGSSSFFFLSLPPGIYQVNQVVIYEGGFRARADVPLVFTIPEDGVGYLGNWRFHLNPPNFSRDLELAISSELVEAIVELKIRYPSFSGKLIETLLVEPRELRSRLYEMTPYPRFRWFNRHNST